MHLYLATVGEFIDDARNDRIAPALLQNYLREEGHEPSPEQQEAWKKSSAALAEALDDPSLRHVGLFLELRMPLCNRRCDVLLVGRGVDGQPRAVVVELKQWGHVSGAAGSLQVVRNRTVDLHPSQQAQDYANILSHFHSAFTRKGMKIQSCAYLHNLTDQRSISILRNPTAFGHLPKDTPLFLRGEEHALRDHLEQAVGGDSCPELRDWIVQGVPEPSPKLLDQVVATIQGTEEWTLIDEQRRAFDTILEAVKEARSTGKKSVVIVRGGPGTGKSVLAIQLLGYAAKNHWTVVHSTGSKAFQTVLRGKTQAFSSELMKKLHNVKTKNKLPVENLFSTFAQVAETATNPQKPFDLIVGDEAHRLWDFRRSTWRQRHKPLSDIPLVEELISVAKVTAFFLDDNQAVRASEIGRSEYIIEHARRLGIEPILVDLNIQFRCNGSASYVEWIDHTLGFAERSTLAWYDPKEDVPEYDFRIFDSPREMQEALQRKREQGFRARLVAGFCWPWSEPLPTGGLVHDLQDPRFRGWSAPWIEKTGQNLPPLKNQYYKWATEPTDEYFNQVGSIYSVQGFEFDYVGVIFGEDLVWEGTEWAVDLDKSEDRTFKTNVKDDPRDALEKLRSVYRVLLTRGMRGTYVCFLDRKSRERFERLLTRSEQPNTEQPKPRALQPKRDSVFISYSRKDEKWLAHLDKHLKPLIRSQSIKVWNDNRIQAGADWKKEIQEALAQARVAVLLVSANFLASDFIAHHELPPLLEAAQHEGLKILWVPIGPSVVKSTELWRYQAVIDPSRPLNKLRSSALVDEALVTVCNEIQKALK